MARSRNIKPGFFTNEHLGELPPLVRLLFQALWCEADREGRLEYRPRRLKAEYFPYDTDFDINEAFVSLFNSKGDFITGYNVDGKEYIQINNWHKHQNPHHMEAPSEIPPPEGKSNRYNHSPITKKQRERIFKRDKGKCVICGSSTNLHIDHVKPVSKGGDSGDKNLQTLCADCNLSKGKRWVKSKSSTGCLRDDNDLSTDRVYPTDSLIPDSLIPDSLIPDSLIPDSHPLFTDPSSEQMTMLEFASCYQKTFGKIMSGMLNQDALDMCRKYSAEVLHEAFRITAEAGGKSFSYLRAVLEGQQKSQDALDEVFGGAA